MTRTQAFTQKTVDKLISNSGADGYTADPQCRGLYLRCQAGRWTWTVRYRVNGKVKQAGLGDVVSLPLEDRVTTDRGKRVVLPGARTQARAYTDAANAERDLMAERKAAAKAEADADEAAKTKSLGAIVKGYLEYAEAEAAKPADKGELRSRTVRELKRYLSEHWKPLHDETTDALTAEQIVGCMIDIERDSGKIAANRARAYLNMCCAWAIRRRKITRNPVIGIRSLTKEAPRRRKRFLDDREKRIFWRALPATDYGDILRLLLLTGQRAEEVAGMRWSEVDIENAVWRLPSERSKNHYAHNIHLSQPAMAILSTRFARRATMRELVFGQEGCGPFQSWSASKRALNRVIEEAHGEPLADWRPHDLRRTMRTGMAQLRIPFEVREACLNHVSSSKPGTVAVYDQYEMEDEKRDAWDAWAAHLLRIVEDREPDNVVELRREAV